MSLRGSVKLHTPPSLSAHPDAVLACLTGVHGGALCRSLVVSRLNLPGVGHVGAAVGRF